MTHEEWRGLPWLAVHRMMVEQNFQALKMMEACWLAFFRVQEHLLQDWLGLLTEHHPFRRWHTELARGADIMDRYGHRAHDVDVERI